MPMASHNQYLIMKLLSQPQIIVWQVYKSCLYSSNTGVWYHQTNIVSPDQRHNILLTSGENKYVLKTQETFWLQFSGIRFQSLAGIQGYKNDIWLVVNFKESMALMEWQLSLHLRLQVQAEEKYQSLDIESIQLKTPTNICIYTLK